MGTQKFTTLLVEGGSQTLDSFIKSGYWDEIQCITNEMQLDDGIYAPKIPPTATLSQTFDILDDHIHIYVNPDYHYVAEVGLS